MKGGKRIGAGRPRTDHVVLKIRLSKERILYLKAQASESGKSVSAFVDSLIK